MIVSASGLLALLAHPTQMFPNMICVTGIGLLSWGAFALRRKSQRVFAGRGVARESA